MSCPICFSDYDNYKHRKYSLINCPKAHTLCRECIETLVMENQREIERGKKQWIINDRGVPVSVPVRPSCPFCRTPFRGIENVSNLTYSFQKDNKKTFKKF